MSREMKDSGIPWIGEIPEGWNCARMKQIGKYVNGYAFKPEDWGNSGKPIIRIQDLTGSNNSPNYYEGDIDEKYLIKNGDILVSWAATLDAFIWGNGEGWLNQHIFKAIPNTSIQKDFFFWLLKVAMSHMNNDNKHGIVMQHLTLNVFGNFIIPIPPLAEQQRIAEFLDRKCAEVDEMIGLQEQIIEELKAYKQSVITEAVTKGLNPDVPMKDSGIEWIGQIPEHWGVCRMKNVCSQNSESLSEKEDSELEFDYVDIGSVSFEKGIFNTEHYKFSDAPSRARRKAKYGDLVISTVRTYLRAIDVIDTKDKANCIYSTGFAVLTPMPHIAYKFLSYISKSQCFLEQVTTLSRGINYPSINSTDLMTIAIAHPSLIEQQAIADYLDEKCADIDSLIQTKQEKIESLKEYKKSIIYEYVSCKKHFKSVAQRKPEASRGSSAEMYVVARNLKK